MDTLCIRHAVAVYCLTRYINVLQSIYLLLLLWVSSTQAWLLLDFKYTRVSSSASVIQARCGYISKPRCKKLAQLKPIWLAYRICPRTVGIAECLVTYNRCSLLSQHMTAARLKSRALICLQCSNIYLVISESKGNEAPPNITSRSNESARFQLTLLDTVSYIRHWATLSREYKKLNSLHFFHLSVAQALGLSAVKQNWFTPVAWVLCESTSCP